MLYLFLLFYFFCYCFYLFNYYCIINDIIILSIFCHLIYNINLLVSGIYCITRRHTAEGWKRMVVECFWEELNKIAKLMTSDIWGHFYFGASKPPYKPNYSFISRSPVFGKSSGRNLELWFTFSPVKWTNHSLAYSKEILHLKVIFFSFFLNS